jgi:serine/threonine protein phosphatase PrpC
MGGHPEGEVAAQLALQTVSALYQKEATPDCQGCSGVPLVIGLMAAHHQIIRYASEKGMLDTPRTTLVAAVVQGNAASWVHCAGFPPVRGSQGGELLTRTRDHSYLEQPPRAFAVIKLDRVNRNILFTCLGSPTKPVFDVSGPVTLQQGDKILLCSDGLWGTLEDQVIVNELSDKSVSDAVPELVELALRRAGATSDNVTVIAMEWETPDSFESTRGISTDSMQRWRVRLAPSRQVCSKRWRGRSGRRRD